MKHAIIGLLAETFIHPGAEQTGGIVDLPVAREKATNYPFIAGSSLKGALLDAAERRNKRNGAGDGNLDLKRIFGDQNQAGNLLVSDARLLLLPVRSLSSSWRWATCPHLLERLARDFRRSELGELSNKINVKRVRYLSHNQVGKGNDKLYLEERNFTSANSDANLEKWIEIISQLFNDADAQNWLEERLVVLHDDDFAWFATNGLAVQARNVLDEKKTSTNLWYEETLPPETLMYALLAERMADTGSLKPIQNIFQNRPYLQVGGNETVGQGWFNIKWEQKEQTND